MPRSSHLVNVYVYFMFSPPLLVQKRVENAVQFSPFVHSEVVNVNEVLYELSGLFLSLFVRRHRTSVSHPDAQLGRCRMRGG